jgi:PAS domain S-box-containing protein
LTNAFSDLNARRSLDENERPQPQDLLSRKERPDDTMMGILRSPLRSCDSRLRFGRLSPIDLSTRGLGARPSGPATQGFEDCCRAMIAQAAEAMILTDSDGTIRIWNRGAERIFGYSPIEALGSGFTLIVPPRLRGPLRVGFQQMIDSGHIASGDGVLRLRAVHKRGGTLYVDMSFGLVRDGVDSVVGAFAIGRDCTARHLAERAMVVELKRGMDVDTRRAGKPCVRERPSGD